MPEPNVTVKRDYVAEIRRLVDEYRSRQEYNAASAAIEIYNQLLGTDRELLYGFLEGQAVLAIRGVMTAADAATRSYARSNGPQSVFSDAATKAEGGDPEPLRQGFLQAWYVVDSKYSRKELRNMNSDDVLFVAERYRERARGGLREAAFMAALAKQIGQRMVGEVFNNVQLAELHTTVTGKI
jgi:hypothetical protein